MHELLVLGLVSAVLNGIVGHTVDATVLAYSPANRTLLVNNRSVDVLAGETMQITVPLRVENGVHHVGIEVASDTTTYHLPVTVVGKRNLAWLWWLTAVPVVGVLLAVRIRKRET